MRSVLIIFLVIFINSCSGAIQENIVEKEKILAVVLIFRHGDRAPFKSFPNDKFYNLFYWPMGFGQLTKEGIQRLYKLGQWLRQRYDGFLNKIYSNLEIHVQSTDLDRTLMSASAALAGLYPPTDYQVWNPNLNWQPIPIHSGYETNIMELPCAKYNKINKEVTEIIYKDIEDKYPDLYQYVKDNSGWINITVKSVSTLRSVMYAYKNYNISFIPEWVTKMNQTLLDHIAGIGYSIATATPTMKRLKVGTFYNYIFQYFDNFTNSTLIKPSPKFMMMSSHDTTITSILNGMGLYKTLPVGFGDTVIMELKKIKEGFFLNLLYKSEKGLEKLIFRNCEFYCDYNTLKKSLINVTIDVDTRAKECAN